MKKNILLNALAALVIVGCQQDDLELVKSESKPFQAVTETYGDDAESRTTLNNQNNVLWKKGDKVSLFVGSTANEQFQVTDNSDGKTTADLSKVVSSELTAGNEIENHVAYYPYAASNEIGKSGSNYELSICLPKIQTYTENSFGNGSFPMVAVSASKSDYNLKFKNVLGALKLQLKGTAKIKSIAVTGNNDEVLCGEAKVSASATGLPTLSLTNTSAKNVTLDCGAGVQLNTATATSFVIALPPMTMTKGFTVIAIDTEGKQMEIKTTKSQTITRSSILNMPVIQYEGTIEDNQSSPFTITSTGGTQVSIIKEGNPSAIILEYRKGNNAWTTYTIGKAIKLFDGESVQFRAGKDGNDTFSHCSNHSYHYYYIDVSGSGTIKASGNIMSLLDRTLQKNTLPEDYVFFQLFYLCKKLTDASQLVLAATTLTEHCYDAMFRSCTSLVNAPKLPATTMAEYCYYGMFVYCYNLINAPELPATNLARGCYDAMFKDCTSLVTAPELPATTLAEICYSGMFKECSNLINAPELPATNLAESCYSGMFEECTSLVNAPKLPATTLPKGCYYEMFTKCTSLVTAPELPATNLAEWCYDEMFKECTSLVNAPELPATTLAEGCYMNMFRLCTSLVNAPELPATTLAEYCYYDMFEECTSLVNAPELPATTLAEYCYYNMFWGCSKLNYVKALFTTTPSAIYIGNWFWGVSPTGTFVKSADATWKNEEVHIPFGWTVEVAK